MIKDTDTKFYDYSFSFNISQILLEWGYKLTKNYFFINLKN